MGYQALKKEIALTAQDRTMLAIESAAVCTLTLASGGLYLAGDLFKRFSKRAYSLGATLDSYALEMLEITVDSLEKYVWKEHIGQDD